MKNLIVLSSPSGGGKSTISKYLMELYPEIKFSVSATTRTKRPNEIHGKDYFFLTQEEFDNTIKNNGFVEYEGMFGNRYGTLKSEVEKAIANNDKILFDIDVKGAMSIKKAFPEESILLFIAPPSKKVQAERLRARSTETEEQIQNRLKRSEFEMSYADKFDHLIINDVLEIAKAEIKEIAKKYIG